MEERDEKGRFVEGNKCSPGRPKRATERSYLAALRDAVPPEAWRKIVERAAKDAAGGDASARNWLSRFLLPQATPDQRAVTLMDVAVEELLEVDAVAEDAEKTAVSRARLRDLGIENA